MAIEARGAKHPYVVAYGAFCTQDLPGKTFNHFRCYTTHIVADSDDEAYGKGIKLAKLVFPQKNQWTDHYCQVDNIGGIDWIGAPNLDKVIPVERPW